MPRVSDAKERLMDAALELIWNNSYGSTTVDLICEKAKVKKGSFYYFFESKADLAVEAIECGWQKKKAVLDQIFSSATPGLDRIRNYTKTVYESQAKLQSECGCVLGCSLFSLGCEIGTQEQKIRAKVEEILQRYTKYLETAIRDAHADGVIVAPNAARKAKLLWAYFQGVLTQARIQNSLEPLREMADGAMELLGVATAEPVAA